MRPKTLNPLPADQFKPETRNHVLLSCRSVWKVQICQLKPIPENRYAIAHESGIGLGYKIGDAGYIPISALPNPDKEGMSDVYRCALPCYHTKSGFKVVLKKSIPTQFRQRISCIRNRKG